MKDSFTQSSQRAQRKAGVPGFLRALCERCVRPFSLRAEEPAKMESE